MYSDLICGNTFSLKAAQCGQVIDAYSVMVTAASLAPIAMSGNDTGLATSAARPLCASASETRRNGDSPARAATPVSEKAAVKVRRGIINGVLQIGAPWRRKKPRTGAVASWKPQLWQWRAAVRPTKGSILLDGGAEPGQRDPQFLVLQRSEAFRDFCDLLGIGRPRGRRFIATRQRRLPERQPADRAPAEEAVDPLQDDVGGVLDFQRHWAVHPQHQGGRFLRLAFDGTRPLDFQRLGMRRDLRACDLAPARHQLARGKPLLGVRV